MTRGEVRGERSMSRRAPVGAAGGEQGAVQRRVNEPGCHFERAAGLVLVPASQAGGLQVPRGHEVRRPGPEGAAAAQQQVAAQPRHDSEDLLL